eukprot:gene12725-20942_t
MLPDAVPADTNLDQIVSFDAATDTFADITVAGVEPRGRRRQEDADRYSASGQTMTNMNERYVAEVAKVKLLSVKNKVVVDSFPMVTRVVVDVPANQGLCEEVSEFFMSMGPDVKTRAVGARRMRVTATGVEPVAAAVLAGMQLELSGGTVMFTAGEPQQMKTAQESLARVNPLAEWRQRLMNDAEHQLPRRWAYDVMPDADAAAGSDSGERGKGAHGGKGTSPRKSGSAASASAASPQRNDVLLSKAHEAVMKKAAELGGLSPANLAQLDRVLKDVGDVKKLRSVASAETKAAFAEAIRNKIGANFRFPA